MPGPLESILVCYEQMGERERETLAVIAHRMLVGQYQYGHLSYGKKNWAKEGFEECCDLSVYMAAKLLDIADEEDRKKGT